MEEIFYDVEDVARMLKLHIVTVRNKVRQNNNGWFKVGTYWRINKSDFETWVNEMKKTSFKKIGKKK